MAPEDQGNVSYVDRVLCAGITALRHSGCGCSPGEEASHTGVRARGSLWALSPF